jgi:hypothetical protein
MTETTPLGQTVDQWLDYFNQNAVNIPDSLFDTADQIFAITDDDEIPQGYYLWLARNYYRLVHHTVL